MMTWVLVDNGKTVIGEGFRRDPRYKDKFYAERFLHDCGAEVCRQHPSVTEGAGASASPEYWFGPNPPPHRLLTARV